MREPIREQNEILQFGAIRDRLEYAEAHEDLQDEECSREGYTEICPICERPSADIEKRPQNTAYPDPEMNWFTSCPECYEINEEYWADMWADYWSDVY